MTENQINIFLLFRRVLERSVTTLDKLKGFENAVALPGNENVFTAKLTSLQHSHRLRQRNKCMSHQSKPGTYGSLSHLQQKIPEFTNNQQGYLIFFPIHITPFSL